MTYLLPRPSKRFAWTAPIVAAAILGLTLVPAEVWSHPTNDQVYSGFDPNLIYATNPSTTRVNRDSIDLAAQPSSHPTVNLITTSIQRFTTAVDVTVTEAQLSPTPLRIGVWSPWKAAGYFVVFGSPPLNPITAELVDSGSVGTVLTGGNLIAHADLGGYAVGTTYRLAITIDKTKGQIFSHLSGGSLDINDSLTAAQFPQLFVSRPLSITLDAAAGQGSSRALVQRFTLTLPHARSFAVKVDDSSEQVILAALLLVALSLVAVEIVARLRIGGAAAASSVMSKLRVSGSQTLRRPLLLALLLAAGCMYLVGNASLFPLGGHPFDMGNEKLFAYVARAYGPDQLYYLPSVVSLPAIWGGVPLSESAFPYGPVMAYLFLGVGWLSSLLFAVGGLVTPGDLRLEYLIKAINVLFGLADGALIYLILKRLNVSSKWALVAVSLFVFNPAVWFSMSVWGQNHVISVFFVLAAVLFAEKHRPLLAWLALAAACLTRPQMLVFGLLLGIVLLRKFSWQRNLIPLSSTVIGMFVVLAPLTLATSPSLPVDITLNNFRIQEASSNGTVLTTVSQDAYSIWLLVTYVAYGASSLQRAFTPTSAILIGGLTYQQVSQILTVGALVVVGTRLWLQKQNAADSGGYLPLVALGITSFLMLQTGLVATHFLLALPFLLLCHRWLGSVAYFYIAAIWTVTTLVPMVGDMGNVVSSQDYPLFAPAHNAVTRFFVQLYASDRFITVSIVANVGAVVWLAFMTFRPAYSARRAIPATV